MIKQLVTTCLLLSVTSVAYAADYYVSDPSNPAVDSANRALLPAGAIVFDTIQKAIDNPSLSPGDNIYVMNGTYTSNPKGWNNAVVLVDKSGSANLPISIRAYAGHHPTISIGGNTMIWDAVLIEGSYINFSGFEIVGNAQNVTLAQATQIAYTEIAGWKLLGIAPADSATNSNCVFVYNSVHVAVKNNLIHDCSAGGITYDMSDYITVESNIVYNTSWWSVYDTSGISIHRMLNSDSYAGYKVFVINNISYNSGNTQPYYASGGQPTDGNGIIIDINQTTNNGKPYLGRTLVLTNIVYNNGGSGAVAFKSAHVDFINNTAYNNDTCPVSGSTCGNIDGGQITANAASDLNIVNNILLAPAGKTAYGNYGSTNVTENHNLFWSVGGLVSNNYVPPDPSDVLADPALRNPPEVSNASLSANNHVIGEYALALTANSPARNVGVTRVGSVGAIHMNGNQDTGIDLGALSYKGF